MALDEIMRKAVNCDLFFADETFTLWEIRETFRAIRDGEIKRVAFWNDHTAYEIRNVTLCNDCRFRNDSINCKLCSEGICTPDDWWCADGKPKGT